jgi:hypothetical protein
MALVLAVLALPACKEASEASSEEPEPYTVEPIEGTDQVAVILTADGAERIGLETTTTDGSTVPESAIWIDVEGLEWVYTSPEPGTFVREQVAVERYEDGIASLAEGLPAGTDVVTVGVAELIGSEFGV